MVTLKIKDYATYIRVLTHKAKKFGQRNGIKCGAIGNSLRNTWDLEECRERVLLGTIENLVETT